MAITMLQKLRKIYPLQLEVIPLFLLIGIIFLTLDNYPGLPDIIPTHFNAQGLPDKWGSKNEIFIFLGMGVFIYALFTGIVLAFAVVRDPKSLINLPSRWKERISLDQAEMLRVDVTRFLLALKVLIMGLNLFLLYSTIEAASNRAAGVGFWPFVFLIATLVTVGFMMFRIFKLTLVNP